MSIRHWNRRFTLSRCQNFRLMGATSCNLPCWRRERTKKRTAERLSEPGTSSEVAFRRSVSLSVQGMSDAANDWRYDGIDDNELTAGGVGFIPQIDAIQEFNVLTYNYSAQYGSRAGSTVLVSTKSGTNAFHGTVFEFLRNDFFDARNYFNRLPFRKSEYRQNEFGGSVGGPIIKDKTFFFFDFQSNRENQAPPIISSIPTVDMVTNHYFTNPIFDPTTTYGGGAGSTRNSYWNVGLGKYVIPPGEISSVGQALLNNFPATSVKQPWPRQQQLHVDPGPHTARRRVGFPRRSHTLG